MTDQTAVRLVAGGGAIVALAVLGDSGLEHYRGAFRNPAMALPLAASTLLLGFDGARTVRAGTRALPAARGLSHGAAAAIGSIGLGFHAYNVLKRPGRIDFSNLFHGAPIGAPAALILAGALGAAGDLLAKDPAGPLGDGRVIAGVAAFGIAGTVAEAALFHFRGAYHDPFMWLPVVVPPIAAASLARDAATGEARGATTALLAATAALGVIGAGFHAWGVHRSMGGWRNWSQNVLAGPPIPAPPAFTGLAVAGIGALLLMRKAKRG